jgi:hypothetical protein
MLSFMATLVQLAGSGAAGVIAAPFIVLAFLFYLCALRRCWASTRTHAAYHATVRAQLRTDVALSARDDAIAARGAVPVGCELCAAGARLAERDTESSPSCGSRRCIR